MTRAINESPSGTERVWKFVRTQVGSDWKTRVTPPALSYDGAVAHESTFTFNVNGALLTTKQYSGSEATGTLWRTVNTTWAANGTPASQVVILEDTPGASKLQSKSETIFDDHGNLKELKEYDYGSGAPPTTHVRKTTLTYLHESVSAYLTRNIINRVKSVHLDDSAGNKKAETLIEYDQTALTTVAGVPQHDYANYPATMLTRGNPTQIRRWLTASTYLTTTNAYDELGNLRTVKDNLNHTTMLSYDDSWSGTACLPPSNSMAYVTSVTNTLGHVTSVKYNACPGLPAETTDPNGKTTTFSSDAMHRLVQTNRPDGGQSTVSFNDTMMPLSAEVRTKIDASQNLVTTRVFDGLGRTKEERLDSDPEGVTYVQYTYDELSRAWKVTNPFRNTGDPTYGVTETRYDALGRVTKVIPPDGSSSSNNTIIAYSANSVTVTDPAGKQRRSFSDALGRLTQVDEPNPTLSTPAVTTYAYDVLDNLLTALQSGSRQRTFTYDALSRLLTANTPEGGLLTYTYDNDGNLQTRAAPAPNQTNPAVTVTTTYGYDTLHRLTSKNYSDSTPDVTLTYDVATIYGGAVENPIGRLVAAERPCHSVIFQKYDAMGRVKQENQYDPIDCGATGKALSYTYDLAGNMTTYTNGVGVTFTQTFDTASRLAQLTSSFVDAQHPATLGSGFDYRPHGAVGLMTYGNGLAEARAFNDRLQATELRTYNPSTGSDIAKFTYGFYDGSGRNNGNVMSMIGQGTAVTDFNRSYAYDELNRLKTMTGAGGACTGLSWNYDIWGNRTDQTPTGGTCSPSALAFDTNNRISGSGYQYDAAGNITYDPTTNSTITYDAENRVIGVSGTLGNVTYAYDALGRRTARQIVGGDRTRFLYDLGGNVVAEWLSGSWTGWAIGYVYANGQMLAQYRDNTTHFVVKDHLGSTRAMTRLDQSVLASYDYLPFGEESSGAWPISHKFTGFERDAESGLDHTWFRKYSSSTGRWLSPDPLAGSRRNPQSLNRYAYVLNNPVNLTDPLGLCPTPRVERTRDWYCRIGGAGGGGLSWCTIDGVDQPCSFGDRFGTGAAFIGVVGLNPTDPFPRVSANDEFHVWVPRFRRTCDLNGLDIVGCGPLQVRWTLEHDPSVIVGGTLPFDVGPHTGGSDTIGGRAREGTRAIGTLAVGFETVVHPLHNFIVGNSAILAGGALSWYSIAGAFGFCAATGGVPCLVVAGAAGLSAAGGAALVVFGGWYHATQTVPSILGRPH